MKEYKIPSFILVKTFSTDSLTVFLILFPEKSTGEVSEVTDMDENYDDYVPGNNDHDGNNSGDNVISNNDHDGNNTGNNDDFDDIKRRNAEEDYSDEYEHNETVSSTNFLIHFKNAIIWMKIS